MKVKYLLVPILSLLLTSCNSDEDLNTNDIVQTALPLIDSNYWTYNVNSQTTNSIPETWTRDSLYVANDTLINNVTHKKMKTLPINNGFYSGFLKNNGLRIDGSSLKLSGSIGISAVLPVDFSFSVTDFVILKENATNGEQLSSTSGSFMQKLGGYPLTFEYTFYSEGNGTMASYTSNGITYNDITKSKVILNLKITTSFSGITVPIMNAQDVLVSSQYYSKNIGLVYNHTVINYTLNSNPLLPIDFPESANQIVEEFLDVYLLN
ncbi:hypothetical protein [uncultured Flavobacterium sp.]|uniref:hypothetical protein n=1 Tax=uncultured Flavobacterium sp. TaxID=165435 RepID=UPI0030CA2829